MLIEKVPGPAQRSHVGLSGNALYRVVHKHRFLYSVLQGVCAHTLLCKYIIFTEKNQIFDIFSLYQNIFIYLQKREYMLGIKPNKAPIQGMFAEKLREEIAVALAERNASHAQMKTTSSENSEK